MPQTTRSPGKAGARFGRTGPSPSAGHFGRSGPSPAAGRFSRPGTPKSRVGRTPTRSASRTSTPFGRVSGRKSKQRKGVGGALAGLLPTGAAAKATPSSKTGKAGGLAALAAASGVAFRNRDKLTALVKRKRSGSEGSEAPLTTPAPGPGQSPPPASGL